MPKETITHVRSYTIEGQGDELHYESNDVTVQWGRETDVTVGCAPTNHIPGDETGWFTGVDRAEINRIIKALRRARDQAYGRDE